MRPLIQSIEPEDRDGNRIDDLLDVMVSSLRSERPGKLTGAVNPAVSSGSRTRVELVFQHQITQAEITAFLRLDGRIHYIYRAASYGWEGDIPVSRIPALPAAMGANLLGVVGSRPLNLYLDKATRNGRVRAAWSTGFAGYGLGFSGDANTTIGIFDTGVDGSHTDLQGREAFWHDYTSDADPTPLDNFGHGSHVTGIATGSGAASGAQTGALYFTTAGNLAGAPPGELFLSPFTLDNGLAITYHSAAVWKGGGADNLYLTRAPLGTENISAAAIGATAGSPITLSGALFGDSALSYMLTMTQNGSSSVGAYAIASNVTYSAVGDGFNTMRGVAPACKWAGFKVFQNNGNGSDLDLNNAIDDAIVRRLALHLQVANFSLGGTGSVTRDMINTMANNGIVVAVAAGNSGETAAPNNVVQYPGTAALAITVAASNSLNQITSFTSVGPASAGAGDDLKPDIAAPGGSAYTSQIFSIDSNTSDAEGSLPDQQPNDYTLLMGTSMASPFIAGCSALVVQALQTSGYRWDYNSSAGPLRVKAMLCATATETNLPREAATSPSPILGRAAAQKDLIEGYGIVNADAAVELARLFLSPGAQFTGYTAGGPYDRRAWARQVNLRAGVPLALRLTMTPNADFDLYLYSSAPGINGNPTTLVASAHSGNRSETCTYIARAATTAWIVVKRVSGFGSWKLTTASAVRT